MENSKAITVLDDNPAFFEALAEALGDTWQVQWARPDQAIVGDDIIVCNAHPVPKDLETLSGAKILLHSADPASLPPFFDMALAKPVRLGQLLAVLADAGKAVDSPAGPVSLGSLTLHPREKTLRAAKNGRSCILTDMETRLLLALAAAPVLPRAELLKKVWRYSADTATHTLETHIWRLRQKVESVLGVQDFIRTESGGYALNPGVVE